MTIMASAPTRVDLAGGTLDLWPVQHLLDHKATVSFGITLNAQVTVAESANDQFHVASQDQKLSVDGSFAAISRSTELPLIGLIVSAVWAQHLPPLTITTAAKSPAGAGLGGSSCLAVTVAGALLAMRRKFEDVPQRSDADLVQLVQDIEARLIHAPTGCQDYWGALRGGVNILRFPFGGTEVTTLSPSKVPGLSDHLILCYSGKSRASALNNWGVFKHVFDGDINLKNRLEEIGELSEQCADAVMAGDLARTLEISQAEWKCRTGLWPSIETEETRRLDRAAREAGARFTRVCGAGGGGVMAMFADPTRHDDVKAALVANGGVVLDGTISERGLQV